MAGIVPFNRKRADILSTGFDSFQNMLDDFFTDGWPFRRSLWGDTFKVDVQDNKTEYIIEAELPGVNKEDIRLALNEGRLNISINRDEAIEEKKQKLYPPRTPVCLNEPKRHARRRRRRRN